MLLSWRVDYLLSSEKGRLMYVFLRGEGSLARAGVSIRNSAD